MGWGEAGKMLPILLDAAILLSYSLGYLLFFIVVLRSSKAFFLINLQLPVVLTISMEEQVFQLLNLSPC